MARRLLAALTAPIVLDGAEVVVGASIGVALAPMQGRDEGAWIGRFSRAAIRRASAGCAGEGISLLLALAVGAEPLE